MALMEFSSMSNRSRIRTSAIAATAVAASAALVAGATLGPTAIQSAQSERTVVADPTLVAETKWQWGGGTAIALAPPPLFGSPGEATAIALLPGAAAALAAAGESATAFSVLGLAVAATDGNYVVVSVPVGQASCIGMLAFANSSTDGMCLNVLGTFDADYNKNTGEVSAALTNPFKLVGLLTGDLNPMDFLGDLAAGDSISRALTDDIVRLTLGGPGFVKLTSDYGFQQYPDSGGGVVIGWLGGQMVLFPVVTGGGVAGSVNYIGLPQFNLSGFPNFNGISNIIPSLSFGEFKTPLFNIPAWSTADILGGSTDASGSASRLAATVSEDVQEAPELSEPAAAEAPEHTGAPVTSSDDALAVVVEQAPEAAPTPTPTPAPEPEPDTTVTTAPTEPSAGGSGSSDSSEVDSAPSTSLQESADTGSSQESADTPSSEESSGSTQEADAA